MSSRVQQIDRWRKTLEPVAEALQELTDELEEALDNMPESIRYNSERGQAAEERVDLLKTWLDSLNEIIEEEL